MQIPHDNVYAQDREKVLSALQVQGNTYKIHHNCSLKIKLDLGKMFRINTAQLFSGYR